jgi:hypothetical protein
MGSARRFRDVAFPLMREVSFASILLVLPVIGLGADDRIVAPPAALRLVRLVEAEPSIHPIDRMIYGSLASIGQQQLEMESTSIVQGLSTEYELSDAQQKKLRLAGRSEARQFFSDVDDLRREYDLAKDQQERIRITKDAESLRKKRSKLFRTGSFLEKVTARTVTDEQVARYADIQYERIRLRHRSNVEGAIRDVERHVVLRISQHEALVDLLMQEIPQPRAIGDFDETLVKYRFSQLPEDKLKTIFDEDQWSTVRKVFDGFQELEPILRQQQLIADGTSPPNQDSSVTSRKKEEK